MPTHTVEQVATTALVSLVLAGDTIGELATVIREQFTDLDRTGGFHFGKEIDTVSLGLIGDHNEHPAGIGVDGGEQKASRSLGGQLRQGPDVDAQETRLVVLEGSWRPARRCLRAVP